MSLGEALAAEAAKQILIIVGSALLVGAVIGGIVYWFFSS